MLTFIVSVTPAPIDQLAVNWRTWPGLLVTNIVVNAKFPKLVVQFVVVP